MKTPTIVKTTKDYMLVKIPFPSQVGSNRHAAARRPRGLTAEDVVRIVAEGERAYRRGRITPVKSLRELMR